MSTEVVRRHPPWLKVRAPGSPEFLETRRIVKGLGLHTVCEEAHCPNIGECWSHRTATVMLLGDTCTRNCGFCAVSHGKPNPVDPDEPLRVAQAVRELGLQHIVVTSVDRDDLPDGGAEHFAATARAIKALLPACRVEVLVPDFQGNWAAVRTVVQSPIDILNHNLETVPRLYREVRPGAKFDRSLQLLVEAKAARPDCLTKAGIMLGLGETEEEVLSLFRDLRATGCDILTVGQYLRPSDRHLPVHRYLSPDEFTAFRQAALDLGYRHVEAAPLVRSSYHAWTHVGDG